MWYVLGEHMAPSDYRIHELFTVTVFKNSALATRHVKILPFCIVLLYVIYCFSWFRYSSVFLFRLVLVELIVLHHENHCAESWPLCVIKDNRVCLHVVCF